MKKKLTIPFCASLAAFCFAAFSLKAQPDKYYQFTGTSFDHGSASEVVEALISQEFVVVGTAYRAGTNTTTPYLAKYDIGGNILWSHHYFVNGFPGGSTFCRGMSVATNTWNSEYGFLVYTDHIVPSQSLFVRVDGMGNYLSSTPLGDEIYSSLIFDPTTGNYVALGQVQNAFNSGSYDLQMHIINGAGIITGTFVYGSNFGLDDRPARMAVNPISGNYTLIGTTFNGTDDDVFIVRTDNAGNQLSADYYDLGGNEEGIDLTAGINGGGVNVMEVIAYDSTNSNPFFLEVDDGSGLVINAVNVTPTAGVTFSPKAIAYDQVNSNFIATGYENSFGTQDAFVLRFDNNMNFMNANYYGQPFNPGDEGFTDVVYNVAGAPEFIFVGAHQLLSPWPGSGFPPGQFYPWLLMTDALVNGSCPLPMSIVTTGLIYTNTNGTQPNAPTQIPPAYNFADRIGQQTWLNECAVPFRMQNPADNQPVTDVAPNPASDLITVQITTAQDAVFEIVNMLGETVMKQNITAETASVSLDVSQLPAGVYSWRLMSNNTELKKDKLVIVH